MGDVSAEPSMEDILSSIKRIIAEEGDSAVAARARRPGPRAVPSPQPIDEDEEVLELNDPMPAPAVIPASRPAADAQAVPAAPILSDQTAQATRGALDSLSRLVVKPEAPSDGTLDGLVRDLLRPMLREWLDAKLPDMVEAMVAREIAKITSASQ